MKALLNGYFWAFCCAAFFACGTPSESDESVETNPADSVVSGAPQLPKPPVVDEKRCEAVSPERALGSLELKSGFELVSSAFIPDTTLAVAAVGDTFFGLNEKYFSLHRLGQWPNLCNDG